MNDLFRDIVPAKAMGIEVASFKNGRITLTAPLDLNINDKGTGFAGSIASMLMLAGWGAVTAALRDWNIEADVMVVKSEIEYSHAVGADFRSAAEMSNEDLERICRELESRGRSRLRIQSSLWSGGQECASMTAHYAIIIKAEKSH